MKRLKPKYDMDTAGWLSPTTHLPSPNCDDRPKGQAINLLVIHTISLPPGEFGGSAVEDFFLNRLDSRQHPYYEHVKDLKVSSHLFIRRNGKIIQFVSFLKRAWHAGDSSFEGIPKCNDYSIGIELEGCDEKPFTEEQYMVLIEVTQTLIHQYPKIIDHRIVGHCDIAPGRKTDPGPYFDWKRYKHSVYLIP